MVPNDILAALAGALAGGQIRVIDLTQTLSPEFPQITLPPEMGQCWPFRIEEVSRYDERGPGWYWNNFSCGEHTGTHFDAPIHWISGRDLTHNAVDTIPARHFVAPAVVIDCSAASGSVFFDQSVRIRTHAPRGMRPWVASQCLTASTVSR